MSKATPIQSLPSLLYERQTGNHHPTSSQYYARALGRSSSHILRLTNTVIYSGHTGCVNTSQWTEDGRHIITGSDDRRICIHSVMPVPVPVGSPSQDGGGSVKISSPLLRLSTPHQANIFSAKLLSPSLGGIGNELCRIISCGRDGLVILSEFRIDNTNTNNVAGRNTGKILARHRGSGSRISIEPGSECSRFASGGSDGRVYLFDTRGGGGGTGTSGGADLITQTFSLRTGGASAAASRRSDAVSIRAIAYRPGLPHELLLGGEEILEPGHPKGAPLHIVDVRNLSKPLVTLRAGKRSDSFITHAAWSRDGKRVVVTANDEHSHIFDFGKGVYGSEVNSVEIWSGAAAENSTRVWPRPLDETTIGTGTTDADTGMQEQQQIRSPFAATATASTLTRDIFTPIRIANALPLDLISAASSSVIIMSSSLPQTSPLPPLSPPLPPVVALRGHRNNMTIKGCAFFGPKSEYVLQPCDSGRLVVYNAATGSVVTSFLADREGPPNNVATHPAGLPLILTSGLESNARLWSPGPRRRTFTPELRQKFDKQASAFRLERAGEGYIDSSDEDVIGSGDNGSGDGSDEDVDRVSRAENVFMRMLQAFTSGGNMHVDEEGGSSVGESEEENDESEDVGDESEDVDDEIEAVESDNESEITSTTESSQISSVRDEHEDDGTSHDDDSDVERRIPSQPHHRRMSEVD